MNWIRLSVATSFTYNKFVGKIRLPDSMNWDEKQAVVDKVIDDLGLRKCENTGDELF